MKKPWLNMIAVVAALMLAAPVLSQDGMESEDARPSQASFALASPLVDQPVTGNNGGSLGKTRDLVFDPASGKVTHLVVEQEEDGRLLAVPIRDVRLDASDGDEIAYGIRVVGADVKEYPVFGEDAWDDAESRATIDRMLASGKSTGNEDMGSEEHPLTRFSEFRDFDLENPDGDDLGDVDDLVLETRTGRIQSVLVSSGGFLGLGESYHSIPYSRVDFDKENVVTTRLSGEADRAAVASLAREGNDDARYEWLRAKVLVGVAATPLAETLVLRLQPGETRRYRVAYLPEIEVAGWQSEDGKKPAESTMRPLRVETWVLTGLEPVEGNTVLSVSTRPENSYEPSDQLGYRVTVTPDGNVTTSPTDTGTPTGDMDRVRTVLTLICGGGIPGREVAQDAPLAAPAGLAAYCGPDTSRVEFRLDPDASGDDDLDLAIYANQSKIGSASYRTSDGTLDELVIAPKGHEDRPTLRIESLDVRGTAGAEMDTGPKVR